MLHPDHRHCDVGIRRPYGWKFAKRSLAAIAVHNFNLGFNFGFNFELGEKYMHKKLIALTVAGLFSMPVFAQSNVTFYGLADAALGFGDTKGNNYRAVLSGVTLGSRVGFRGIEDLGNGLKAVYVLEHGFNIDTGTALFPNSAFSRQAHVGLQGDFGTVSLGRQYAPGHFAFSYHEAIGASLSPQATLAGAAGLTILSAAIARWDNSIAYSGKFGSLTTRAIYSAQNESEIELGRSASDDDRMGFGAEYANGPLKLGVIYHLVKDLVGEDQKEWYLGAVYNFGMLSLHGTWQNGRDVGPADRDLQVWSLGTTISVTATSDLVLSYGSLKERDLKDADARNWTVQYNHHLSKRTMLYAAYNRTHNDSNSSVGALFGVLKPTTPGESAAMAVFGMRHRF